MAITPSKNPAAKTPKSIAAITAAKRLKQQQSGNLSSAANADAVVDDGVVVESGRYEEWMKLATDNVGRLLNAQLIPRIDSRQPAHRMQKITSANAWNYALIDYFADMTLLRNGNGDNSINFQKASCTLDGCVKIWTSRVDSVATETGKLLSGLAEDGKFHSHLLMTTC